MTWAAFAAAGWEDNLEHLYAIGLWLNSYVMTLGSLLEKYVSGGETISRTANDIT
jgi:hypothetical protein